MGGFKLTAEDDYITNLLEKEYFLKEVEENFYSKAEDMGVLVSFHKGRALDVLLQVNHDLRRIEDRESKVSLPDHIKVAALTMYWLRRISPVSRFTINTEIHGISESTPSVEFMMKYGREYLAFDFGYKLAHHYECNIEDRSLPENSFSLNSSFDDVPKNDLVEMVVHVLKLKNVSPHALILLLKAIFLRP